MLDPSVGEGVVQAMRKEVHRMELRQQELLRTQERLMQVRCLRHICISYPTAVVFLPSHHMSW